MCEVLEEDDGEDTLADEEKETLVKIMIGSLSSLPVEKPSKSKKVMHDFLLVTAHPVLISVFEND